jgi:hypothetical protein
LRRITLISPQNSEKLVAVLKRSNPGSGKKALLGVFFPSFRRWSLLWMERKNIYEIIEIGKNNSAQKKIY